MSRETLSRWTNRSVAVNPQLEKLELLARALEVPIGALVDARDEAVEPAADRAPSGTLGALASIRKDAQRENAARQLYEYLLTGEIEKVIGFVTWLYLNGMEAAEIIDGPVRESMAEIGQLWKCEPRGICLEHQATNMMASALYHLANCAGRPSSRAAVGGAVEGDSYLLPTLAISTVLSLEGYRSVNLGPSVPLPSLASLIEELEPDVVWLSCSTPETQTTGKEIVKLAEWIEAPLIVGGQATPLLELPGDHPKIRQVESAEEMMQVLREKKEP